jgi:hypothetical protein
MKKKFTSRVLISVTPEFREAVERLQAKLGTSSLSETVRMVVLRADQESPK